MLMTKPCQPEKLRTPFLLRAGMICWCETTGSDTTSDVSTSVSSIDVVTSSSMAAVAGVTSNTLAVCKHTGESDKSLVSNYQGRMQGCLTGRRGGRLFLMWDMWKFLFKFFDQKVYNLKRRAYFFLTSGQVLLGDLPVTIVTVVRCQPDHCWLLCQVDSYQTENVTRNRVV